jgi:heme A synthase
MNKNKANKILAPILAVLVANQILTGAFGTSLPPAIFGVLHQDGAYVLLTAIVVHLGLNSGWIRANYFRSHLKGVPSGSDSR